MPRPGVDQDRRLVLVRGADELAHRRLGERELLGPRVQLDAVDARVQAAPRLVDAAGSFGCTRQSARSVPSLSATARMTKSLAGV
jgi:hypothetical protein